MVVGDRLGYMCRCLSCGASSDIKAEDVLAHKALDVQSRTHSDGYGLLTTWAPASKPENPGAFRSRRLSIEKVETSVHAARRRSSVVVIGNTAKIVGEKLLKKTVLFISIVLCLLTAGRVVVILGRIVLSTAEQIARDFPHYQKGFAYRVHTFKEWISTMTEAKLGKRVNIPVNINLLPESQILAYANDVAMIASRYIFQQVVPHTCITTLFLVFLLINPVKADGRSKDILELCSDYVKVKSGLSTVLGFLVGISLMLCDLELYYAAGLLVAFANFIPNGALICSVLPCIFALFDDRKYVKQVVSALTIQIGLINGFAFVVEPIFFGATIEMHPIPAILGVTFFGYVWGVPGMLISIPLLGAFRLVLAAWAKRAPEDDKATIQAIQGFIEGRWTVTSILSSPDADTIEVEEELSSDNRSHSAMTMDTVSPASIAPEFTARLMDIMAWFGEKYKERKVCIDGLLYFALVFFLFSPWSDRVFGITGEAPSVQKVLHKASQSAGNFHRSSVSRSSNTSIDLGP
eukprot:CAMPEP_0117554826 /NCGR_PEP_ID=MMETSP0784-20121206/50955_1 /TAXON_ID=39447 /ORGANISM="" /LENGTH=519 /DNA_ID=CAMNT_0005352005 /DNA_START=218 /DNA_END=1774 /DNA_ORIENTATION=+